MDERALIPRPETEELVILILDRFQDTPMRVLDVGTGSGCLAITLAAERPSWKVLGVDIEEKAIDLSLENARNLGVRAEFAVQDILKDPPSQSGEFDLIVSNPPYITIQEKTEMDEWVIEYEPKTALFVDGDDPLLFYKKILQYAVRQKNRPVNLFFELNPKYAKELKEWNRGSLNLQSDIHVDMSGKERFLLCRT